MKINLLKKYAIPVTVLICVFFIIVLSSYKWYRPIPCNNVICQSDFNADITYKYIDKITNDYQYRIFGSKEVGALGNYIENYFLTLNLKVINQKFISWRPSIDKFYLKFDLIDNDVDLFSDTYKTLIEQVEGNNVIGISYGISEDAILIGAHRDMALGSEGAEDNASGTGLMMELAREISEKNHYYTYIFVSFDGEEAQEKGSDYFVKNFEDIDLIKLAIILDQVGYKDADSLMLYETYGSFNQLPFKMQALLKSCLDAICETNISFDKKHMAKNGLYSLLNHLYKMAFVSSNTDCNPFFQKKIPAFGIKAINSKNMTQALVHSENDTLDNIGVETLKMSGNFVKTLIATIENDKTIINNLSGNYDYIISGDLYLPAANVIICKAALFTMIFGFLLYAIRYIILNNNLIKLFVELVFSIIFSVTQCLLIRFGISTIFENIPILWLAIIWLLIFFFEIKFIKKIIIRMNIDYEIRFVYQYVINIIVFIILFLVSSYEYAMIITLNAFIFSSIYKSINNKYKKLKFFIEAFYIIIHFIITLAVFNVFLRGVNITNFTILQIMNLFMYLNMNINVFSLSNVNSGNL